MADIKNTQEAEKTSGSQPGATRGGAGTTSGMAGQTGGQTAGQTMSGQTGGQTTGQTASAARQSREQSPGGYGSQSTAGRGSQTGSHTMDQMKQSASEAYDRASQSVNQKWEQAMDYGREHPGQTTLIAFGVGVGVGLLLAGGFATRSRTQRLVPPVMNALSEIAREVFR